MHSNDYGNWMKILIATAVVGLAVRIGEIYLVHLVLGYLLLRGLFSTSPGSLLARSSIPSNYHLLFPGMFLWFAVGLLWSWDRMYTLQYLGYIGVGGLLAMLIVKYTGTSRANFQRLFGVAAAFCLADLGCGLLEVLTPFRLPVSPYAMHTSHWNRFAELPEETIRWLTSAPTGFHWNPNNYAVVANMMLPFFVFHRRLAVRVAGTLVIAFLIYAAGSRANLASLGAMLLLTTLYSRRPAWVLSLSVMLSGIIVFFIAGPSFDYEQIENRRLRGALGTVDAIRTYLIADGGLNEHTMTVRHELIRNGMAALHSSYGMGVGGGADKWVQENNYVAGTEIVAMHHFWIELLVNGGYLFFLAFAIWYAQITIELLQFGRKLAGHPNSRYYCASLSLALIGFVPGAISASSVIYVLPMYLLFAFACCQANICRRLVAESSSFGRTSLWRQTIRPSPLRRAYPLTS